MKSGFLRLCAYAIFAGNLYFWFASKPGRDTTKDLQMTIFAFTLLIYAKQCDEDNDGYFG